MSNFGYWLKRLALNLKGFFAALLAAVLPSGFPFVRKLVVFVVTFLAMKVYEKLGLDFPVGDASTSAILNEAVEWVMAALGAFALYRVPNAQPTIADQKNPIVKAATDIPPT